MAGSGMNPTITIIARCPVCGAEGREKTPGDIGFTEGQLTHKICTQCIESLPEIDHGSIIKLAENGNPHAIGLCRTLTGVNVQSRGPYSFYKGLRSPEVDRKSVV